MDVCVSLLWLRIWGKLCDTTLCMIFSSSSSFVFALTVPNRPFRFTTAAYDFIACFASIIRQYWKGVSLSSQVTSCREIKAKWEVVATKPLKAGKSRGQNLWMLFSSDISAAAWHYGRWGRPRCMGWYLAYIRIDIFAWWNVHAFLLNLLKQLMRSIHVVVVGQQFSSGWQSKMKSSSLCKKN